MLDLFCGRWGWSRAFAARGWECIGLDLVSPAEIPDNCKLIVGDVLGWCSRHVTQLGADFICASPPCQEFSKHGLRCFWPAPPYPHLGIELFNHTRSILQESGIPYVMENVSAAQEFVGLARHHCGPFYLWGTGVPPLMPQGIQKGLQLGNSGYSGKERIEYRKRQSNPARDARSGSKKRADATAEVSVIPYALANCVAEYAERLVDAGRRRTEGAA